LGLGDKSSAISGFERRVVNFTLRPSLTTCPLEGGPAVVVLTMHLMTNPFARVGN
jgi:hypothetical protein